VRDLAKGGLFYGWVIVLISFLTLVLVMGTPNFGKILGLLDIGFGLGAALGSYLAGVLFDHFRSYDLTFYLVMVLILTSMACIWMAAPRPVCISSSDVIVYPSHR
jgi:MFS family permease